MATKRRVIQLSFKNDSKDDELFTFLEEKLNAPSFIKEVLWSVYRNQTINFGTPIQSVPTVVAVPQNNVTPLLPKQEEQEQNNMAMLFNEEAERDEVEF